MAMPVMKKMRGVSMKRAWKKVKKSAIARFTADEKRIMHKLCAR